MNGKYNGWTNYATWLINLEMFDDYEFCDGEYATAEYVEDMVNEWVIENTQNPTMQGLMSVVLSDVNWQEIADSLNSKWSAVEK